MRRASRAWRAGRRRDDAGVSAGSARAARLGSTMSTKPRPVQLTTTATSAAAGGERRLSWRSPVTDAARPGGVAGSRVAYAALAWTKPGELCARVARARLDSERGASTRNCLGASPHDSARRRARQFSTYGSARGGRSNRRPFRGHSVRLHRDGSMSAAGYRRAGVSVPSALRECAAQSVDGLPGQRTRAGVLGVRDAVAITV